MSLHGVLFRVMTHGVLLLLLRYYD